MKLRSSLVSYSYFFFGIIVSACLLGLWFCPLPFFFLPLMIVLFRLSTSTSAPPATLFLRLNKYHYTAPYRHCLHLGPLLSSVNSSITVWTGQLWTEQTFLLRSNFMFNHTSWDTCREMFAKPWLKSSLPEWLKEHCYYSQFPASLLIG